MSVIIPDMKMPKTCNECRFSVNGFCRVNGEPNGYMMANRVPVENWCPLIEKADSATVNEMWARLDNESPEVLEQIIALVEETREETKS